jgi:hypothetical protein
MTAESFSSAAKAQFFQFISQHRPIHAPSCKPDFALP